MIAIRLAIIALVFAMTMFVMIYGWGLTPQNWFIIIVGWAVILALGIVNKFLEEY